MKHQGFVIANATAQPRLYRTAWGVVTLAFWAAYLYLWLPAATLLMWVAGVRLTAIELYLHEHRIDVFVLSVLPLLAMVAAALLIGWAELNRVWFVGKERRLDVPDVQLDAVAVALHAPLAIARALQETKIARLRMDADAIPCAMVDCAADPLPTLHGGTPATAPPFLPAVEA